MKTTRRNEAEAIILDSRLILNYVDPQRVRAWRVPSLATIKAEASNRAWRFASNAEEAATLAGEVVALAKRVRSEFLKSYRRQANRRQVNRRLLAA